MVLHRVTVGSREEEGVKVSGGVIEGDVLISGWENADLSNAFLGTVPLSAVKHVKGSLIVGKMWQNDEYVGESNPGLKHLTGLGVERVEGSFWTHDNPSLMSLQGIGTLKTIRGDLWIESNPSLETLDHLKVQEADGYVKVMTNPSLQSLNGLNRLSKAHGVVVWECDMLKSLAGLNSMQSLSSYLDVRKNGALESFDGLQSLASVAGDVFIEDNPNLASLTALGSITKLEGGLMMHRNGPVIRIGLPCTVTPSWQDVDENMGTWSDFCGIKAGAASALVAPASVRGFARAGDQSQAARADPVLSPFSFDAITILLLLALLLLAFPGMRRRLNSKTK